MRIVHRAEIYKNMCLLRLPASPSAGTFGYLRGLGERLWLYGYRVGTDSFVMERPHSQVKKCQIIPKPKQNSASKGLR